MDQGQHRQVGQEALIEALWAKLQEAWEELSQARKELVQGREISQSDLGEIENSLHPHVVEVEGVVGVACVEQVTRQPQSSVTQCIVACKMDEGGFTQVAKEHSWPEAIAQTKEWVAGEIRKGKQGAEFEDDALAFHVQK